MCFYFLEAKRAGSPVTAVASGGFPPDEIGYRGPRDGKATPWHFKNFDKLEACTLGRIAVAVKKRALGQSREWLANPKFGAVRRIVSATNECAK